MRYSPISISPINLEYIGEYTTSKKFVKKYKDGDEEVEILFNPCTDYSAYNKGDGRILLHKPSKGGITVNITLSKNWFNKLFKKKDMDRRRFYS